MARLHCTNTQFLQIKIKSDSLPVAWEEDGIVCKNGDHLKADVVVFSTGFIGNLRLLVAEIFGPDVAGQVDNFWGLDEEGELKGAFKPSGRMYLIFRRGLILMAISRCCLLVSRRSCRADKILFTVHRPPDKG